MIFIISLDERRCTKRSRADSGGGRRGRDTWRREQKWAWRGRLLEEEERITLDL